ncbi:uncharacterized protein TRAVEDRAFT_54536 [Trametes versicolor FP-101664 SS1]|uniref:Uncharacterized protein n=1 Tax=Trametes versicolor (strain FP-101664) TaxID=717944 RepID=R7S7B3_TRAVS|nr:uncharacterized protein TRAVEDRAFT_54536 [Trametes versicolor FP-101664 SS1]EIW51500.1 hypothetical protein TRAVEDRAFT_54536 [Trametes versicolor FP-101664 SS1]
MPTYGQDKIRRFGKEAMIPAFEGLMPLRDDQTIADLLFELANWHALAKLRLHTAVTIKIPRAATTHMTDTMRHFSATTCERWETHELPREVDARVHRKEKRGRNVPPEVRERRTVHYNVLNTFKFHGVPDYPDAIEMTSPSDTGSTQVLDDYVPRRERLRQDRLARMAPPSGTLPHPEPGGHDADGRPDPPLPPTNPLDHYAISNTSRLALGMRNWISRNRNDPAADNCIPLLRAHLLGRLLDLPPGEGGEPGAFTDAQLDHIEAQNDRIYRDKVLRVNYTTYDIRRDQDIIKPGPEV